MPNKNKEANMKKSENRIVNKVRGIVVKAVGPTGRGRKKPEKVARLRDLGRQYVDAHVQAKVDYLMCLLRPELYAAKVPSPLPVQSCLCQVKGNFQQQTSANGSITVMLQPFNDQYPVKALTNNTFTSTDGYSTTTWVTTNSSAAPTYVNAVFRRPVAAVIEVSSNAPDNVRCGQAVATFLPYSPLDVAGVSADTLIDQPGAISHQLATHNKVRSIYIPYDQSWNSFTPPNTKPNTNYSPSIVIQVFGAIDGSNRHTISVSYRVIYEFIPMPAQSDLLIPQLGPYGSAESTGSMVSELWNWVTTKGVDYATGAYELITSPSTFFAKRGLKWAYSLVNGSIGGSKSSVLPKTNFVPADDLRR